MCSLTIGLNFCTVDTGSAPLTTVQLLWVNLIMDTLGALALATEPPHKGLMNRPPVRRDTGFITNVMWRNIIGQSTYQLAVLSVFSFMGKQLLRLEDCSDAQAVLNTFIFNTFVFCQVYVFLELFPFLFSSLMSFPLLVHDNSGFFPTFGPSGEIP